MPSIVRLSFSQVTSFEGTLAQVDGISAGASIATGLAPHLEVRNTVLGSVGPVPVKAQAENLPLVTSEPATGRTKSCQVTAPVVVDRVARRVRIWVAIARARSPFGSTV